MARLICYYWDDRARRARANTDRRWAAELTEEAFESGPHLNSGFMGPIGPTCKWPKWALSISSIAKINVIITKINFIINKI